MNTVLFVELSKIKIIPKDQVLIYAQLLWVMGHRKKDPNHVKITAGGNLIKYPFEISVRGKIQR
jgi:hypothetical protein